MTENLNHWKPVSHCFSTFSNSLDEHVNKDDYTESHSFTSLSDVTMVSSYKADNSIVKIYEDTILFEKEHSDCFSKSFQRESTCDFFFHENEENKKSKSMITKELTNCMFDF